MRKVLISDSFRAGQTYARERNDTENFSVDLALQVLIFCNISNSAKIGEEIQDIHRYTQKDVNKQGRTYTEKYIHKDMRRQKHTYRKTYIQKDTKKDIHTRIHTYRKIYINIQRERERDGETEGYT